MKRERKGSIYIRKGVWYYDVTLPGEKKKRSVSLKVAGSDRVLTADRPRRLAEQAASRYWEMMTGAATPSSARHGVSVEAIISQYLAWLPTYYRTADGKPTAECECARCNLRGFRKMYGEAAVTELTHRDMMVWRAAEERSGCARSTVNHRVFTVKRMFAWALDQGLVEAVTKAELTQITTLKRGRSLAHEAKPVRAVDDATIEKAMTAMMPSTADMVGVHRLTGMRPEEVCGMKWAEIDVSGEPWVYRPARHKNEWRGQPRVVLIGPRARAILGKYREREASATIFSPKAALADWVEWCATREAHRGQDGGIGGCERRGQDGGEARRGETPKVNVGMFHHELLDYWRVDSYRNTIGAACRVAGVAEWTPNRLRHAFATEVRRKFGVEAVRVLLGHSGGRNSVDDVYSFEAIEDETIAKGRAWIEAVG